MDKRLNQQGNMVQVSNDPCDEDQALAVAHPVSPDEHLKNVVTLESYKRISGAMMSSPVPQTDANVALGLLETALTNRNVPIARQCISDLNGLIAKDNALKMLNCIGRWIVLIETNQPLNYEPSAPPLIERAEDRNEYWMKEPLRLLRENILLEIDKEGDYFLKQSETRELNYQDLLDITTRDTMQVSSEVLVYTTIMDWALQECDRKGLAPEDINVKAVLKDLIYAPRYGLMTKKQFRSRLIERHRGPDRIGIPADVNEQILMYIVQRDKKDKNLEELPYNLSKKRLTCNRKESQSGPMKEKMLLNLLSCFTAVFD